MTKDYCPKCKLQTNHLVMHSESISSSNDNDFEDHWSKDFEIIQCKGCDNIQFRTVYEDEHMRGWDDYNQEEYNYQDKKYYPSNLTSHYSLKYDHKIPEKIRIVYYETVNAMVNGCYILSGVGLRAIIEAICLEENIKGRSLELKINNLEKGKLITQKDSSRLHSIRFLGNDSVHDMDVPNEKKLRIALDIIENLIKNLYLIDLEANQHLDTIISNYDEFKTLFMKKSASLTKDDEKSIKEIMGKSFRRIEQTYLTNFTQQFMDEINNGSVTSLSVGAIKKSTVETQDVQHFVKI